MSARKLMEDRLRLNAELVVAIARKQLVAHVGYDAAGVQWLDGYIQRQHREVEKLAAQEQTRLPTDYDYDRVTGLRREARQVLTRFKPATLGQAGRLAGVTPADIMLLTVAMGR